jgi:F-type H+-transporting ATPase subunit delta
LKKRASKPAPAAPAAPVIPAGDDLERIFAELELVDSSLRGSLKLKGHLENPRVPFDDKVRTIRYIFKDYIGSRAYDFVLLLLRSNTLNSLTEILRNFRRTRQETGILELEVKTAVPLSNEEKNALTEKFSRRIGKPLTLRNIIDRDIIAGMVVKAGDIMIDASVRSKLSGLTRNLRQGQK